MVQEPSQEEGAAHPSPHEFNGAAGESASIASEARATEPEAMTERQLAEAKEYGRKELTCGLADKALDVAFLAVMATIVARPLDQWLSGWSILQPPWTRLAALFLLLTLVHIGLSFPLSFYSGHLLEHRYGLSRQSLGGWLWRYVKRNLLTLCFGLLMVQGLYWMIWLIGDLWWLAAAGMFFLVSVAIGQLAPVLILPLFYKITRLDDEQLTERLSRLSAGTGLSIEGIYRMDLSSETAKANAMLAGLGRTRRVILGDTLLDSFSPEEIEVIFAHEIGHHVHRHIRKMILAGLVYSAASFLVCDLLVAAWVTRIDGGFQYASLPIYTLPMLMLVITLLSMLLEPLQNMMSRHFERQSDWYALQRTGRVDSYRSAFQKLARLNKADPDPHPVEVFLFHSHPTISQRLAMAEPLRRHCNA